MSVLKGFGKIVGSLLFTTFLTISLTMLSLTEFTSYSNLKTFATGVLEKTISQQIGENQLNKIYDSLRTSCAGKDLANLDLGGLSLKIKCSDLKSQNDLPKLISSSLFDSIYYKTYTCSFLECLQQPGTDRFSVLLSQHANDFLKSLQYALLAITGIGAAMLYVSADSLKERLRVFGKNLAFTGGSYIVFNFLMNFLIPKEILEVVGNLDLLNGVFGSVTNYFIAIFVLGIVLLILSYMKRQKKKKGRH